MSLMHQTKDQITWYKSLQLYQPQLLEQELISSWYIVRGSSTQVQKALISYPAIKAVRGEG